MRAKRITATLAVPAFVAAIAWLGGYDFDTRGFWSAWAFGTTVLAMVLAWNCPVFDE